MILKPFTAMSDISFDQVSVNNIKSDFLNINDSSSESSLLECFVTSP